MDEVSYVVNLLENNWNTHAAALLTAGDIDYKHSIHPIIIDVRNLVPNKAQRFDLSKRVEGDGTHASNLATTNDVIIVMEMGQNLTYPTLDWSVRDENYTFSINIKTKHDNRKYYAAQSGPIQQITLDDTSFGIDRLESIYKVLRRTIEQNRKGATVTVGSVSRKFDQIHLGNRTDSNDKKNKIFGYKVNLEIKNFAITL